MLAIHRGDAHHVEARIDKSSKWRESDLTKPARKLDDLNFGCRYCGFHRRVEPMKSILRNLALAPALMAAAALMTTSAMAETAIKVPFNFTVGGKVFPAGRYVVERDDSGSFVSLINRDVPVVASWVLTPGSPAPTETKIALKFDEVGHTHVLQSIQYGGLITSKLDKNLEHQANQTAEGR
jgi:hypothetical protein